MNDQTKAIAEKPNLRAHHALVFWVFIAATCLTSLVARGQEFSSEYEGLTQPHYDIMVAATEIGRISEILVEVGDVIEAGHVIARLEDSSQAAAVESARFRAGMHGATDAAKAEAALAAQRLKQLEELDKRDMTRPDEVARAMADLEIAKARQLDAVEQDKLRDMELGRYELQLERRRIKAPISGIVAKVIHQPGEYLTPGDPAVIRLINVESIFAVFNLPPGETLRLRVGDTLKVHLESLKEKVDATVHSISPVIDGESDTVEVRFLMSNADGRLRSGDRCRLSARPGRSALRITPRRAQVVRQPDGSISLR